MRLKAPFYRFALALLGFLLPSVIFAAMLPSLINAEPVKRRFIEELQSWTGAKVELRGPVAIESFFSLSFNAQNVEFDGFEGLGSLKSVNAGQVVARIAWMDLFTGNLDFDKVKIYDAAIHLGALDRDKAIKFARAILSEPQETPFAAFVLDNCKITIEGGGKHPLHEIAIESFVVNLDQESQRVEIDGRLTLNGQDIALDFNTRTVETKPGAAPLPIRLDFDSPLLNARFDGVVDLSKDWRAQGDARLYIPEAGDLSRWLGEPLDVDLPGNVRLSGALDLSARTLSFAAGEIVVGSTKGAGDLTFDMAAEQADIAGTLAFEQLDLRGLWEPKAVGGENAPQLIALLRQVNLDLRVSARHMSWAPIVMESAAFTLTGRGGAVSAEIAQLDVLGGSILGHLEADLKADRPDFHARLSAVNFDAARLWKLAALSDWLEGQMDVDLEAKASGADMEEIKRSAKAKLQASFPDGGRLRMDPGKVVAAVSGQDTQGWDAVDTSWWDFSNMRAKLSLQDDRLHCDALSLQSREAQVEGSGEVDLGREAFDWHLTVKQSRPSSWLSSAPDGEVAAAETNLSISGPWARPLIQSGKRSSRAGEEPGGVPEAKLAGDRL